jgi:GWxTD domain-containing protein
MSTRIHSPARHYRYPLAVLVTLLLFLTSLQAKDRKTPPLKAWIDGPVRYIANKSEAKTFRKLGNDRERALFIEHFWQRRDPTPETLTNEYRYRFWKRVQEANAMVFSSPREGWITDRGKIYILYGPPTNIEQDSQALNNGIEGGGRGLIRWIYEGRPGERRDLRAVTVVAFVGDTAGEYKLTYDPKLTSIFFTTFDFNDANPYLNSVHPTLEPTQSRLSMMLDLGRLQEVPPIEEVILERVETTETYKTFDLGVSLDRFQDQDGRVGFSVNLDFGPTTVVGTPALLARFTPTDATQKPRILSEGSFRFLPAKDGQSALAQGRIFLPPGRYDLLVAAIDPTGAGNGIYRGTALVPAPTPDSTLALSDLMMCRTLTPLPYASLVSYQEPFVLGPYRCTPRVLHTLHGGEPIEVLFETYGGVPPYRLSYQLEYEDELQGWKALGAPQKAVQAERAHAWGLDTSPDWPVGDYRLRIVVLDSENHEITGRLPFSILPESPPTAAGEP